MPFTPAFIYVFPKSKIFYLTTPSAQVYTVLTEFFHLELLTNLLTVVYYVLCTPCIYCVICSCFVAIITEYAKKSLFCAVESCLS